MKIRGRLILTLVTIFIASTAVMGLFTYNSQMRQLRNAHKDLAVNQDRLFHTILTVDAEGLARAHSGLTRLEPLLKLFVERNRPALADAVSPIFRDLKQQNKITHMYFIEPDGTVFLRAHKPEQFGDRLTRATFRRAANTGRTASGLEMGANFFSLRCVTPITYRGKMVGYLEVAEEIDHVFGEMKAINGIDVSLFLKEDYLEKYRMNFGTEKVAGFSLLYPTNKHVSLHLAQQCKEMMPSALSRYLVRFVDVDGTRYAVGMGPIEDAFGNIAGVLLAYEDVTATFVTIDRVIITSLFTFMAIFLVSLLLFYFSLRKSLRLFGKLEQDIVAVTKTSDLSKRLQVTTDDEVGELAANFNLMKEEIQKLHENLAVRAEQLAAANRELETFNYTVSHDLRKPLTIINGYCQAILDMCGSNLDDTCREYMDEIYSGTLRMNQLIDALLSFSVTAREELHRERVDLSRMAETVAAELRLTEPERMAEFRIAEGITCNGDASLLRLVMENLLGNAWKYTAQQEHAFIEFGERETAGERVFFVRDNGTGFDMAHADRLFIPLKRLPGTEQFKGHGIGLATVARIVQRHGGTVWAESEPDKGATFYFTIRS